MAIKSRIDGLKLISSIVNSKGLAQPQESLVRTEKGNINKDSKSTKLKRVKPSYFNIDEKYLDSFFNEIARSKTTKLNKALILKDGKVIREFRNVPYEMGTWNSVFSFTKSVTGLAIGLAYDEGYINLDESVYSILEPKEVLGTLLQRSITVRHLLTNSSGALFNEVATASTAEWVKDFFNYGFKFIPGMKFEYNSLNSYMLSAILKKKTGLGMSEYLKTRLFDKLEIYDYYFEKSFEDIEKGGWGLYITIEDMAKLAILVMNRGVYNKERIISEEWMNMMTSPQFRTNVKGYHLDYGFQIWCDDEMIAFNGLFDQDAYIYKKTGFILITCSSNNDAFHTNNQIIIANKYFNNYTNEYIEYVSEPLEKSKRINRKAIYNKFNNRYFEITNEEYKRISFMPLILQMIMNKYGKGFNGFSFSEEKVTNSYIFNFHTDDKLYSLKFNFNKGIKQTLDLYGDMYEINVKGNIYIKNGNPHLELIITYLEFASERKINISLVGDKFLRVNMSENPNEQFLYKLVYMIDDKRRDYAIDKIVSLMNSDLINRKVEQVLYPKYILKDKNN